jgi:hypothetical protein
LLLTVDVRCRCSLLQYGFLLQNQASHVCEVRRSRFMQLSAPIRHDSDQVTTNPVKPATLKISPTHQNKASRLPGSNCLGRDFVQGVELLPSRRSGRALAELATSTEDKRNPVKSSQVSRCEVFCSFRLLPSEIFSVCRQFVHVLTSFPRGFSREFGGFLD